MTLALTPLHPLFAAEAGGVDLKKPLDAHAIGQIEAAMDRYALLVFRDQPLDQDEQVALARQFGPLDAGLRKATGAATRFAYEELIDISNLALDGSVASRDNAKLIGVLANQLWHSDSSFQNLPVKYSMLSAVAVPAEGGDTEWCDLRAAYDALPEATRRIVEGRTARHSAFHSRMLLGDDRYTDGQMQRFPPVERPLVGVHPGSKRKLLFVGVHCDRVSGMSVPEGRLLIAELLEHATRREFVYRHTWRPGDYVIWDNRSTLHRGRRYDLSMRRDLRRTTTLERHAAPAAVD
ncbi:MAG: TauD/TfdA family dioxygenase [Betaproteobacteria bacterium]|nr:TauD/TfdA family dioxygenase [Betaproteobacteria bacterium]